MSHDELSELLQALPRDEASPGFTARTVAAAVASSHPTRHRQLRSLVAFVLSAILILSGALGIRNHQQQVRMRQLRAEQQEIRKELDALKQASNAGASSVFVGSSGPYDFVIDLQHERSNSAPPASLHIADDGVY